MCMRCVAHVEGDAEKVVMQVDTSAAPRSWGSGDRSFLSLHFLSIIMIVIIKPSSPSPTKKNGTTSSQASKCQERPHHADRTTSRPLCEVKRRRARLQQYSTRRGTRGKPRCCSFFFILC